MLLSYIGVALAFVVGLSLSSWTPKTLAMSFYYLTFHYSIACCAKPNSTQDHSINKLFSACAYTCTIHSVGWPLFRMLRTCKLLLFVTIALNGHVLTFGSFSFNSFACRFRALNWIELDLPLAFIHKNHLFNWNVASYKLLSPHTHRNTHSHIEF